MVQHMSYCRDIIKSDHICACISSFDQFRRFRAGFITLRTKRQVSTKWPEMVHNDTIYPVVARYVHLWTPLTQRSSY